MVRRAKNKKPLAHSGRHKGPSIQLEVDMTNDILLDSIQFRLEQIIDTIAEMESIDLEINSTLQEISRVLAHAIDEMLSISSISFDHIAS